ncbi:mitochondrial small ribosomal subunit Rsm22-domain-containing protein [Phycomyces nitens]|nr:mitochondrial small ribosomal subunit Rsm22-domain-containing protein [Phycomyces nitens]
MTSRLVRTLRPTQRWIARQQRPYSQNVIFMDEKDLSMLDIEMTESFISTTVISDSGDPVEFVRGSPEAEFGRKRIGCVHLPKPLAKGILDLIEAQHDKRLIRVDALRLFDAMRSTARIPEPLEQDLTKKTKKPVGQEVLEPHNISYGPREALAYTAGVLPASYAAISNVFEEINNRLGDFKPKSMLDFGTGPGTAIWAAQEVFDIKKYVGVDLSEDMLRVAEQLEECAKKPESVPIEFKRYLAFDPTISKPDLVVSAFALGDIASTALQKSTIEQLWEQAGDVLVLIERGTPIGFSAIARARQWILDAEKEKGKKVHVVAPCPHDRPCPLLFSPEAKPSKSWCHFSQRVERPSFLMKTKHSKFNTEDAKYSYVVLRRGERPLAEKSDAPLETLAFSWPRLIQPPLKNKGHVVMDLCVQNGQIQRTSIPKSQGKIPYRDARKSMWGDLFPHPSKTKMVTRMSEGVVGPEEVQRKHKKAT